LRGGRQSRKDHPLFGVIGIGAGLSLTITKGPAIGGKRVVILSHDDARQTVQTAQKKPPIIDDLIYIDLTQSTSPYHSLSTNALFRKLQFEQLRQIATVQLSHDATDGRENDGSRSLKTSHLGHCFDDGYISLYATISLDIDRPDHHDFSNEVNLFQEIAKILANWL